MEPTEGRPILRIRFGSHLFGTATATSDIDLKSVYVPTARNIVLQRVTPSIVSRRRKDDHEKNVATDIDEEAYSLQKYLALLADGQSVALDLLFAPAQSMLQPAADEWNAIVANRHRLVTRRSASFVAYCRQQALKYGIKGSRLAAARAALGLLDRSLETMGTAARLQEVAGAVRAMVRDSPHMAIVAIPQISGAIVDHWEVCGRKLSFSASIKNARDVTDNLVHDYGQRAIQAEAQGGVDWKAVSHAVRIATQALELFETGSITLPLPNRAHVLAIKQGQLPYPAVAEEIERLLEQVEVAAARSSLPPEPDRQWIDDFVATVYAREVQRWV